MADTEVSIGYGTVLEIALATEPNDFTYIREVYALTPPSDTDDSIEATHMQSPNKTREYIPGLTDSGEASAEMNYVPGSDTDRFIQSIKGKKLINRVTFENGIQVIFRGNRQGYEKDIPVDDRKTATLTLRVSGDPIMTGVTAPRNIDLPLIEGVAKVGSPLTVDWGIWAGAEDLSYQWKVGGDVIANANTSSYVPVTADIGDTITVDVTGTNTLYSATVSSAATAAVTA